MDQGPYGTYAVPMGVHANLGVTVRALLLYANQLASPLPARQTLALQEVACCYKRLTVCPFDGYNTRVLVRPDYSFWCARICCHTLVSSDHNDMEGAVASASRVLDWLNSIGGD